MYRRDFMPRSHNAALEKREGRFHSVCMHITMRVFPRVVNRLVQVPLHFVERIRINGRFIGHNHFYMAPDIGIDNFAYCRGLRILSANQSEVTIALSDADDNLLDALWTPAPSFATNVCFV